MKVIVVVGKRKHLAGSVNKITEYLSSIDRCAFDEWSREYYSTVRVVMCPCSDGLDMKSEGEKMGVSDDDLITVERGTVSDTLTQVKTYLRSVFKYEYVDLVVVSPTYMSQRVYVLATHILKKYNPSIVKSGDQPSQETIEKEKIKTLNVIEQLTDLSSDPSSEEV